MSEHCIIDGERCSKCCEVLTIRESGNFRQWLAYARRHGESSAPVTHRHHLMLVRVSKRRAKKINPKLVKSVGCKQSYFKCKNFTGSGCGIYETRPKICSHYPYYGIEKEKFLSDAISNNDKGLYADGCTYYIELK